jgi:hypothetical protein
LEAEHCEPAATAVGSSEDRKERKTIAVMAARGRRRPEEESAVMVQYLSLSSSWVLARRMESWLGESEWRKGSGQFQSRSLALMERVVNDRHEQSDQLQSIAENYCEIKSWAPALDGE